MLAEDAHFLRPRVRSVIKEFLEAEMADAIGLSAERAIGSAVAASETEHPRGSRSRSGVRGKETDDTAESRARCVGRRMRSPAMKTSMRRQSNCF
jgi:hypothetical protein